MTNLTPIQQGLVDGLIKEFTKINPKPSANGSKRFSIDTISECQREEERFLATITKHNQTMIKVFEKQFADEMKAFAKEYGKIFTTQLGYMYSNTLQHGYDEFIKANKNGNVVNNYNHKECYLHIVSKQKSYQSDSRYNYCNGKAYIELYLDFKRERVAIKLESGKEVYAYKICGLKFKNRGYLNEGGTDFLATPTFDELMQTDKHLQRRIVAMAS